MGACELPCQPVSTRILLIAETDEILSAVPAAVEALGHRLITVSAIDDAANSILRDEPDLVLLDAVSHRFRRPEAMRMLAVNIASLHTPVIALTGDGDQPLEADYAQITVFDYVPTPFHALDLEARIGAGLRTKRFQDQLREASTLDPATSMLNRRSGEERVAEEISRVIRYGRSLSCVIVQIETDPTEEEMQAIGEDFRANTRLSDVLCRWDRHRILVILPETGPFGAVRVAENLRRHLKVKLPELPEPQSSIERDAGESLTALFGASGYVEGDDQNTLVGRAEAATAEAVSDPAKPVVLARISRGSDEVRYLAV